MLFKERSHACPLNVRQKRSVVCLLKAWVQLLFGGLEKKMACGHLPLEGDVRIAIFRYRARLQVPAKAWGAMPG